MDKVMQYQKGEQRDDFEVYCAFNSGHRMPESRLFWHYSKCPDKKKRMHEFEQCENDTLHYYLKGTEEFHFKICQATLKKISQQDPQKIKEQEELKLILEQNSQNTQILSNNQNYLNFNNIPQPHCSTQTYSRRSRNKDFCQTDQIKKIKNEFNGNTFIFNGDCEDLWTNYDKYKPFLETTIINSIYDIYHKPDQNFNQNEDSSNYF